MQLTNTKTDSPSVDTISPFSDHDSFASPTSYDHDIYYYACDNINMVEYSYEFFNCHNFSKFESHTSVEQTHSNFFPLLQLGVLLFISYLFGCVQKLTYLIINSVFATPYGFYTSVYGLSQMTDVSM